MTKGYKISRSSWKDIYMNKLQNHLLGTCLIAKTVAKMNIYHPVIHSVQNLIVESKEIKKANRNGTLTLAITENNFYNLEKIIDVKAYQNSCILYYLSKYLFAKLKHINILNYFRSLNTSTNSLKFLNISFLGGKKKFM